MKKLVATIVMIVFFTCNPAFAFVPVAIPAVAIGAGALIGAAINLAGLYFYMKPGSKSNVSNTGEIKRPSNAVWVDLKDFKPSLNEKDVSAKMSFDKAKELSNKKNSDGSNKYPQVANAMKQPEDILDANKLQGPAAQGQYLKLEGGAIKYKVIPGGYGYQESQACPPLSNKVYISNGYMTGRVGSGSITNCPAGTKATAGQIQIKVDAGSPIGYEPATPPNFAKNIAGLGVEPPANSPLDVSTNYQEELDRMFQDPDYVPTFSDDTTGLPFSPPAGVLSPSQLAAANAAAVAQEAKESAASSSQSAASSAGTAATTAANNYAASGGDPQTGVGGDPALLQKLRDAEASAAAAQAALDKLKADQAVDDAENLASVTPGLPGDNTYDPSVTAPDKKNITELLTSFAAGSPLISMVRSFTVTTSDSSGVVPIGNIYGQELSFDFTRWESILRTCGGVLILIMHGYAVLIVVRGW